MEMEQIRALVGDVFMAIGVASVITAALLTLIAYILYWIETRR